MQSLIIFGGFAALIAAFTVISAKVEKRRREALRATAAQLGLEFAETDQTGLQSGFSGFSLFRHGSSRRIRNIVYGRVEGVEVILFDYSYTTGSGKNRHTSHQTVGFFQSDTLGLPEFVARPEGMFDKIGQVFGYQDIDLPMHPEFSRKFILRGANEAAIRRAFTPGVARFFEENAGLSIEAKTDRFILYRSGTPLKPEQWAEWMRTGLNVVRVLGG